MKKATELEYLQWIYANMDFGPAHEDVMAIMNEGFQKETGMALPDGYGEED